MLHIDDEKFASTIFLNLQNKIKKIYIAPKIPRRLRKNFINIDSKDLKTIELSLKNNFFKNCSKQYLSTKKGKKDLFDHLIGRIESNRYFVIPWLDYVKPLKNSNILEIGSGTGCSTITLAEQGANVIALDIDQNALNVAKERCKIFDLDVDFFNINATEVQKKFSRNHFDFIIFYASLEHMTLEERISSMKTTYDILPYGGLWSIIETPNRLWYYDSHTSLLPFFSWL
ncbi:unnamed protein product, partial [marine sediment metagenome]